MSQLAIVGMFVGILAFLTFCMFIFSVPMAITAIILGHMGLSQVRKQKPHMEGGWQAITALVTGYSALFLSVTVVAVAILLPRLVPPDDPRWSRNKADTESELEDGQFAVSASTNEAFKSAEYEIASKQGKPAGRGNSPEAIALASEYAERIKELSDELFTTKRRALVQLSGGEYLTYCEMHEDRVLFLVHVPSYRKFTGDAKKALAEIAWAVAQVEVAGKFPPNAKLGVGLRGVLSYGDIMLGTCPASPEDKISKYQSGKESDLLTFFVKEPKQPQASAPLAANENSAPVQPNNAEPAKVSNNEKRAGQPAEEMVAGDGTAPAKPAENPFVFAEPKVAMNEPSAATAQPPMSPLALPPGNLPMGSVSPFSPPPATFPPDNPTSSTNKPKSNAERRPSNAKIDFSNQVPVRLVTTIANPLWAFKSLAFSPDGKWLAGGKADEAIYVFNARSGEEVCKLERLNALGQAMALAYSANGEYLAAGGDRGQVMCWKVAPDGTLTGEQMQHRFESAVEALITSPKHSFFMGANRKGTIAWQSFGPNKSQPRLLQEFSKNVRALWLPTSGTEALATDGQKLITFSLKDGEISGSKDTGVKDSRLAAFSPSGKRLVIASSDTWHFFDLENMNRRRTQKVLRGEMIHSLAFHQNERWVASGIRGKVALLDFDKAQTVAYADTDSIQYQDSLAFSNDGKFLATCPESAQGQIKIFELGGE